MQENYDFKAIEARVRQHWDEAQVFTANENSDKPKYYCLSMFSYPSGKLHMGHVRNYTIGDVIARFYRLKGYNVLQPFGWDAFGLPAENAALQSGNPPSTWTYQNIDYMRMQLQSLGLAIDWSREFATCSPEYYRFQQELFIKLHAKGLIYRKTAVVNWDPIDMTVLANEQVIDGRGWRSGAIVVKKEIPMYYFKITQYAEELLTGLDTLDGWPHQVKTMQKNWIGKSQGAEIHFPIVANELLDELQNSIQQITIFTTRADTLFGASYIAVAHDHPLATCAAKHDSKIAAYLLSCESGAVTEATLATQLKTGIFSGFYVKHPLTSEQLPVWITNYVVMSYGSGAVMGVPAHDERDFEFANKYNLAIKPVIAPADNQELDLPLTKAYTGVGVLVDSGDFTGMKSTIASGKIVAALANSGLATVKTNYRLRDWGLSRQRYWGCPIPMIHCTSCGDVPVNVADLPVVLPENIVPDGSGSPLAKMPEFYTTKCPKCGVQAKRETDTMDTFVDSSWYYARFAASDCKTALVDERANYWLPADQYIGGIEHAVLHLLYARFMHKCLRDLGYVNCDEPFTNLLTQGMVLAETYYREDETGRKTWFNPADIRVSYDDKGQISAATFTGDGLPVAIGGLEKMSKSKNNGIDPQTIINNYGADTVRLFMLFAAPPELTLEWSDNALEAANRFIRRLWRIVYEHTQKIKQALNDEAELTLEQKKLRIQLHQVIEKVTHDILERKQFNTAIASIMELLNSYNKVAFASSAAYQLAAELLEAVVIMLSPMIPHVTDELWQILRPGTSLLQQAWVKYDASIIASNDTYEMIIQVNGKLRGRLTIDASSVPTDKAAATKYIEDLALANPNVQKFIVGGAIKKIIVVPTKLVNIVC